MKRVLLSLFAMMIFGFVYADNLICINLKSPEDADLYRHTPGITINYQNDYFVICTSTGAVSSDYSVIDENAWENSCNYYLLWVNGSVDTFVDTYVGNGDIIYTSTNYVIVKTQNSEVIHHQKETVKGVVRINNREVPVVRDIVLPGFESKEYNPMIANMISQINLDTLYAHLWHLQNYGTRRYDTPTGVQAQNWLKDYFESYGYDVELQQVNNYPTHNVIAKKIGTKYPDEYVVCGCHYDSYTYSGLAPGADDNGTGTCGMMEIARLFSDINFDRSIIICCFAAEEIGLYGSEAYATRCNQEDMNILGYFNIDMSGYLQAGSQIHTSVIYPNSAEELFQYYKTTCETYVPNLLVERGQLMGGDSDHTSFNNNGYMGIYPFEDGDNHSPYIHTSGDTIGTSVNCPEQFLIFTQACMANVMRMSFVRESPNNLLFTIGTDNDRINLTWNALEEEISEYKVYRNGQLLASVPGTENTYTDEDVELMVIYNYYVTAVYAQDGYESDASNTVEAYMIVPLSVPFTENWDVNNIVPPYWSVNQVSGNIRWELAQTGMGVPAYPISMPNMIAMLGSHVGDVCTFSSPRFNLSNLQSATLTFLHSQRRKNSSQDHLTVYYKSSAEGEWNELSTYTTDVVNWKRETIQLPEISDDYYIMFKGSLNGGYGLQIDNINVTGVSLFVAGDANVDGVVNTADVMAIVSYILGDQPDTFAFDRADVNQDGAVNIRDIIGIINIIFGK